MNLIFLIIAVLILRYLAYRANEQFELECLRLFRVRASRKRMARIVRDQPEKRGRFLVSVLPYSMLQVGLDLLACGALVAAFWIIPPARLGPSDLVLVRYAGLFLISGAGMVELGELAWVAVAALAAENDPA